MAVTPMDAAVDAQERETTGEPLMVPFPAITDEKGEPIQLPIRELSDGQGITLMNIQSRSTRPSLKQEQKVELSMRFFRLVVSLIDDDDLRALVEDEMALGQVNGDDISDLFETILEAEAGRPTESSSASRSSRRASGPSSPAKSQRRVSASKRAASGGSATSSGSWTR